MRHHGNFPMPMIVSLHSPGFRHGPEDCGQGPYLRGSISNQAGLFQQLIIPASPEEAEGLCRQVLDRTQAARSIQMETVAGQQAMTTALSRLASGAALCRHNANSIQAPASA
jgi:hypothetical protein